MNQEWVTVSAIADGGVWVESLQRSACDSCNARSGCGQRTLANIGRTVRLWVPTNNIYQVGQQVRLQLPSGGLALSALLLYGVPLLMLLVLAAVGQTLGEFYAIASGTLGLVVGLMLSRKLTQIYKHLWQPKIL